MNDRARLLDRISAANERVDRVLRRTRRDPDVLELARAVRDLTEAAALLLIVLTPEWADLGRPSDGPNCPPAVVAVGEQQA